MITVVRAEFDDPALNLAVEEVLLELACSERRRFARVWVNPRSVVVGRSLDLCEEVRCELARAYRVPVLRRVSGGGAVYHDEGNVNLTVAAPLDGRLPSVEEVYSEGLGILLGFLRGLGLKPRVENGNDVVVGGRKVSGSAAYVKGCGYLFHATLLVSSDIGLLRRLLVARLDRVVRGEVTPAKYEPANLRDFVSVSVGEAVTGLMRSLEEAYGGVSIGVLGRGELERAKLLRDCKYLSRAWLEEGREPKCAGPSLAPGPRRAGSTSRWSTSPGRGARRSPAPRW